MKDFSAGYNYPLQEHCDHLKRIGWIKNPQRAASTATTELLAGDEMHDDVHPEG
jgi:hypothetical protein